MFPIELPADAVSRAWLKTEEALRWARQSKVGREQGRRRFILVGTGEETRRMGEELQAKLEEEVEILATLDLNEARVERLVELAVAVG